MRLNAPPQRCSAPLWFFVLLPFEFGFVFGDVQYDIDHVLAVAHAEFRVDVGHMGFHGVFRQNELFLDVGARAALCQSTRISLSRGESL